LKYLKLTNNEKCLQLASCLIGSHCDDVATGNFHKYVLEGVRDTGRKENSCFNIRENDGCGYDAGVLIIPLDDIKLNPFVVMSTDIRINCVFKGQHNISRYREYNYGRWTQEVWQGREELLNHINQGSEFSLDLQNLPDGATVVEMDGE